MPERSRVDACAALLLARGVRPAGQWVCVRRVSRDASERYFASRDRFASCFYCFLFLVSFFFCGRYDDRPFGRVMIRSDPPRRQPLDDARDSLPNSRRVGRILCNMSRVAFVRRETIHISRWIIMLASGAWFHATRPM